MPINYSTDLWWRAVWLVTLRGMSYEEVGKVLFMSERSVRRYVDHFFSTGNADPEKQNHGPQCLLSEFALSMDYNNLRLEPQRALPLFRQQCLVSYILS